MPPRGPFYAHVMTTSNHRPFTYPEGRIDIPSRSGRDGGVKYTDYAIGRFIEQARVRPFSRFFGHDILLDGPGHERALMANYQTVGYYERGRVVELKPNSRVRVVDAVTGLEARTTSSHAS